tara:strand:+ start:14 stop:838 length:825 start_codon:yes stop_codon:yes gene_type:complete
MNDHSKIIEKISFPTTDEYYERTSADGYAFLGYALNKLGLNWDACLNKMSDNNFTLNADKRVRNVNVYKHTNYTYTLSFCLDFLNSINDQETFDKLFKIFKSIGFYKNENLYRYCDTEIYYGVPNTTSAAAWIFALSGDIENCQKCLNFLSSTQKQNGNWNYYNISNNKLKKLATQEDSFHIAMMVTHLRLVQSTTGIDTSPLYLKSIKMLETHNKKILDGGSIGWGIPMLYLATKGMDTNLNRRSYEGCLQSVSHKNFRVRSISAYCLTKDYN